MSFHNISDWFNPQQFYPSLALIRIPRDPTNAIEKPNVCDYFGTGFFATKGGILFTAAHNLTCNGEPHGPPLPWVWVYCYNVVEDDWIDEYQVVVEPSLIEPTLDAAILRVEASISEILTLARSWQRGDNVIILGFQPDNTKASGFNAFPLFCDIPTNWPVVPFDLNNVRGEPVLRIGITGISRGQQPLGRGMSGGAVLNCELKDAPAIGFVKGIEWPDPDQHRPPEVKTTALGWLWDSQLIERLPFEDLPILLVPSRKKEVDTKKRIRGSLIILGLIIIAFFVRYIPIFSIPFADAKFKNTDKPDGIASVRKITTFQRLFGYEQSPLQLAIIAPPGNVKWKVLSKSYLPTYQVVSPKEKVKLYKYQGLRLQVHSNSDGDRVVEGTLMIGNEACTDLKDIEIICQLWFGGQFVTSDTVMINPQGRFTFKFSQPFIFEEKDYTAKFSIQRLGKPIMISEWKDFKFDPANGASLELIKVNNQQENSP